MSDKLNVIFVTRFYPPDTGGGGIAAYARYVALGLLHRGHQVCVISRLTRKSRLFQLVDGVKVYRIPAPLHSYRWTRLPFVGRYMRFMSDLLYAWQVRRTLLQLARTFKPNIVEYADIDAEGFFHASICPYVVKLHTPHAILRPYYTDCEVPYARRCIEKIEASMIYRADGISSPSRYLAIKVAQLYGLDYSKISWVPNPIDTDFFSPTSESLSDSPPSVLYVGRLEPLKGALVFAKAIPIIAKAIPNVQFIYLGADRRSANGRSQRAELEIYFEREGVHDRVLFHGHAPPEVFRDFYRRATVFVMPSLFENCPYTLLEAMACGKPVIVSAAGGMPEIVEDGETGVLFEPGNSEALAEITIDLLRSPARRAALGRAAREVIVKHYSLDVGAAATEQFYKRVLSSVYDEYR